MIIIENAESGLRATLGDFNSSYLSNKDFYLKSKQPLSVGFARKEIFIPPTQTRDDY
jgi:hypothetical protein